MTEFSDQKILVANSDQATDNNIHRLYVQNRNYFCDRIDQWQHCYSLIFWQRGLKFENCFTGILATDFVNNIQTHKLDDFSR